MVLAGEERMEWAEIRQLGALRQSLWGFGSEKNSKPT